MRCLKRGPTLDYWALKDSYLKEYLKSRISKQCKWSLGNLRWSIRSNPSGNCPQTTQDIFMFYICIMKGVQMVVFEQGDQNKVTLICVIWTVNIYCTLWDINTRWVKDDLANIDNQTISENKRELSSAKLSSLRWGWVELRLSWVEAELELKLSWDWDWQVFEPYNWSIWSLQLKYLK